MYAIIEDSGTQIKVSQGDVIKVAIRDLPGGAGTIQFDRVLLIGGAESGATKIGTPLVAGAKVTGDVLAQEKTDRVESYRFRRRKNILKSRGHRQDYLKVKVTAIEG
jgi:large subunit ribosomal protein L21